MTQRVLGPTGSRRRRRFLLVPTFVAALLALMFTAGAQAVHDDGFFELGPTPTAPEAGITNILGNATDPGPDWADIFDASGNVISLFGGHAAAFIADPSSAGGGTDPTTFSGFGTSNKNNDPISTADCANRTPPLTGSNCSPWGWDSGNVPAKDDLTNVYAYEVINPANNHLIVYGGIEREDPSGDSHVDLEFFQDQVALGSGTSFTGVRTVNDVIIVMDFVRGGGIGSVKIFSWNGSEYVQAGVAGGEGCFPKPGGAADSICAFNNGASIDGGPWPNFDNHGAQITTLEKNAFTEIGVDLTELIGASPCLSTFMGKTRSSASFTAELKDFAGPHNFDLCQPSTSLSASASAATIHSGDSVTLTFSELNDGNENLLNPTVTTDSASCNSTMTSSDPNNNGKLDIGETWTFTCTVTPAGDLTVVAIGSAVGELSGDTVTYPADPEERAEVSINVINPSTTLSKTAKVDITYTYRETNTGDDPLSAVSVSDDKCSPVSFSSGDANSNGKLDPGETWIFTCTTSSTDGADYDVTNTGTGHGTDSLGAAVPTAGETDKVRVRVDHCPKATVC